MRPAVHKEGWGIGVLKIDQLVQRVRAMSKGKPLERVQAFNREVVMTNTQAWRFRELQAGGFPERPPEPAPPPDKPWYGILEASERVGRSVDDLLEAAARGTLTCFVDSTRLQGRWEGLDSEPKKHPERLMLSIEDCGTVRSLGSANVEVLELRRDKRTLGRYRLAETQFVDPARMLLRHPLPNS